MGNVQRSELASFKNFYYWSWIKLQTSHFISNQTILGKFPQNTFSDSPKKLYMPSSMKMEENSKMSGLYD